MQDLIALAMELNAEDYFINIWYRSQSEYPITIIVADHGFEVSSHKCKTRQAACDWLRKDEAEFRGDQPGGSGDV